VLRSGFGAFQGVPESNCAAVRAALFETEKPFLRLKSATQPNAVQQGGKASDQARIAPDTISVHTPAMTLKNAALLALIGTILATVLLTWTFVSTVLNVLRGLAPPAMLFPWFVYAFACFSVAVFFYVFHRAQS
jgi:hypothetical protein